MNRKKKILIVLTIINAVMTFIFCKLFHGLVRIIRTSNVFEDVAIPNIKKTLVDMWVVLIYGRLPERGSSSRVSYQNYYDRKERR